MSVFPPCDITLIALLDRNLRPIPRKNLTKRVMAQLWESEVQERLADFRQDYRIAWLVVFLAPQPPQLVGEKLGPWERAFRQILGASPARLIPFFMARTYAGHNFPPKYLPFRFTKHWQEDFAYILQSLGLPEQNLIPEFIASAEKKRLAQVRPALPPKKPSTGVGTLAGRRKGVA